jgi:hypothetical protein
MDEQTTDSVLSFLKFPKKKATILQNMSTFSNFWTHNKVHFYIHSFYKYDIIDIYASFFEVVGQQLTFFFSIQIPATNSNTT